MFDANRIRILDKPDVTQTELRIGFEGVKRDTPDFYALSIMNYILGGGGFSSRVLDAVRDSGQVEPDRFPQVFGSISFFVNAGIRFVEEMCKMRAFSELWDEITRDRYGVKNPKYRLFRYGVQVNSLGLTADQVQGTERHMQELQADQLDAINRAGSTDPEAIRKVAEKNKLPVDRITQVSVLDVVPRLLITGRRIAGCRHDARSHRALRFQHVVPGALGFDDMGVSVDDRKTVLHMTSSL